MNALRTRSAARWLFPVACAIAAGLGAVVFSASGADDSVEMDVLPLKQVADVPLGGRPTRLDYASVDADRHLL